MKRFKFFKMTIWLSSLLFLVLAPACSSFWGLWGKKPVSPTVSQMYPSDAATNVRINGSVIAVFSKDMAAWTIIESNFTVSKEGVPISGKVIYTEANRTAIFKPMNELMADTTYTVIILSAVQDSQGHPMATNQSWNFTTGKEQDTKAPTVVQTFPGNMATGVAANAVITTTFSETMAPATLIEANIIVKAGTKQIAGTVTSDMAAKTMTFTPSKKLTADIVHTVLITLRVTDVADNTLSEMFEWSFTPGTSYDTMAPTVIATFPENSSTGTAVNEAITASFSEEMNNSTINEIHFTLKNGVTPIIGSVTYDLPRKTAIFSTKLNLAFSTTYTAMITNGAKDLAGNPLVSNKTWSFTTAPAGKGPAPVPLGNTSAFTLLAQKAITNLPPSAITGNIGLSPADKSFLTGFSQIDSVGYATSPQVTGFLHIADMAPPATSSLIAAISNMKTAYANAAGRAMPDYLDIKAGNLSGMSLLPGLYRWDSSVSIPSEISLSGGPNDVWIFQISGDLIIGSGVKIVLQDGAQARNIFWQVGGTTTLGSASRFEGIILCQHAITVNAKAILKGRAFSQTELILNQASVSNP